MSVLATAWDMWDKQDDAITIDEGKRFRQAIHDAQRVLADRALRRAFPGFWQ